MLGSQSSRKSRKIQIPAVVVGQLKLIKFVVVGQFKLFNVVGQFKLFNVVGQFSVWRGKDHWCAKIHPRLRRAHQARSKRSASGTH